MAGGEKAVRKEIEDATFVGAMCQLTGTSYFCDSFSNINTVFVNSYDILRADADM